MKKIILSLCIIATMLACNNQEEKGKFTVQGNLKNAENQKVYLEQLFFSEKNPEVLDTAEIKAGKFEVAATGSEEGLYRLRLEKQEMGFIFINDKSNINFSADANDISLDGPNFNTPANKTFKSFLVAIDAKQKALNNLSTEIDSLKKNKKMDSLVAVKVTSLTNNATSFKKFIVRSIDSIADPVVAMFALGYTRGIDPAELKTVLPKLAKRYPTHAGMTGLITIINEMISKKDAPPALAEKGKEKAVGKISVGNMAPDFTLKDTEGNPFSLSSLKGNYVLIDFWASWCGPCRAENPNVVANYNKYKTKNFTILGVSLDEDKNKWLAAIKTDNLIWKHISDLKGWANEAAVAYGVQSIPFNLLLDPTGKIIAIDLRGEELGKKLEEEVR